MKHESGAYSGWIVFFHSVPSKPVGVRMKAWRRLMKAGAVQLKGAVYVLPFSDEHMEFAQWLASEIGGMKGEAGFVRAETIGNCANAEIVALFDSQRRADYQAVERTLDGIDARLASMRKGSSPRETVAIMSQCDRLSKELNDIRLIDFFDSEYGRAVEQRFRRTAAELKSLTAGTRGEEEARAIEPRSASDYQGRAWITRSRPFVDRMASAWLIRKFIDGNASFGFIDENGSHSDSAGCVAFDVADGDFTHVGEMCTFEVIAKAFAIRDKAVARIAKIVHRIDVRDDRFDAPEAKGIEEILGGIRKSAADDMDALVRGMAVFEMLYVSMS